VNYSLTGEDGQIEVRSEQRFGADQKLIYEKSSTARKPPEQAKVESSSKTLADDLRAANNDPAAIKEAVRKFEGDVAGANPAIVDQVNEQLKEKGDGYHASLDSDGQLVIGGWKNDGPVKNVAEQSIKSPQPAPEKVDEDKVKVTIAKFVQEINPVDLQTQTASPGFAAQFQGMIDELSKTGLPAEGIKKALTMALQDKNITNLTPKLTTETFSSGVKTNSIGLEYQHQTNDRSIAIVTL
jgi:hypothetical protein